ncbi:MAG: Xcc1710-like domain-containing protein [Gammaproteobacteria bacterium]|nr:Xcc1710-like domain-containing protein [Gammaproteobacteria bacterium]
MKFQLDSGSGTYRIQGYLSGEYITVNAAAYTHSLLVMPEHLEDWPPQSFEKLEREHFERLHALKPDVVLFGSGTRIRFPEAFLLAPLINNGIGVEVMDTGAACRTYAALMAEDRNVAAALLL